MARRTLKVGISGKYGTRYGRAARKIMSQIETSQRTKYTCPFCMKDNVRREAAGIWECRCCKKQIAGGAYSLNTATGNTCKSNVRRIRAEE